MPDLPGARVKHEHVITGQVQVVQANKAVSDSFDQVKAGIDVFSAKSVIAANQALELAGKMASLASSVADAAKAGAAASDIAKNFSSLGDAVPAIEALRAAVAGSVDATALRGFAMIGEEMRLTADESVGLAQRFTVLAEKQGELAELSDILTEAQESPLEALKKLGVIVDDTQARYEGLSEAQKIHLLIQEQAALGSQAQVDALESSQVAVLALDTQLADMRAAAESAFAEWLIGSGVLERAGEVMQEVSQWAEENAEFLTNVGNVVGDLLVTSFNLAAVAGRSLLAVVETLGPGLVVVLDKIAALEESDIFQSSLGRLIEDERLRSKILDAQFAAREKEGRLLPEIQARYDAIVAAEAARGGLVEKAVADGEELAKIMEEQGGWANISAENFVELNNGIDGAVARLEQTDFGLERVQAMRGELASGLAALESQREEIQNSTRDTFARATALDEVNEKEQSILTSLREIVGVENTLIEAQWRQNEAITVGKDLIEESAQAEKDREARRKRSSADRKRDREDARKDLLEFDELITELLIDEETAAAEAFIAQAAAESQAFQLGFALGDELRSGLDAFFEDDLDPPPIFQGIEATAAATANLAERNAILAGSFSAVASSMGELDFASDSYLGKVGQVASAMDLMVTGLDQAGDSTAGAVAAVAAASAEVAGSVFESTTAQAALLAVFSTAQGIALLPNVAAATPKFVAAATFATAAAMSFAGVGGKSAGAGASAGAGGGGAAASAGSFEPSLAREPDQSAGNGPGITAIFQFSDVTGRDAVRVADVLNEGARNKSGIRLDSSLFEGF